MSFLSETLARVKPSPTIAVSTLAAELKAAIRTTGGYPIAQGFLTPEAALMVCRPSFGKSSTVGTV